MKITDELKKCKDEKNMIEIYNTYDMEDDSFYVGIILDVNENFFIFASISKYGEFNGVRLDVTDTVYRICKKSRYLDKLREIMRIRNVGAIPEEFLGFSADISDFLKSAKKIGMPVSFCFESERGFDLTGFVREVGEDYAVVDSLHIQMAKIMGSETVSTDRVTFLCCGDYEEQMLYELKKSGFII